MKELRLLIITSSFPTGPDDETCGYIREFARSLSSRFRVKVLAPPARTADDTGCRGFEVVRSRSSAPGRMDPFDSGADLSEIDSLTPAGRLRLVPSLLWFAFRALALARHADVICSHWLLPSGLVGAFISFILGKPHIAIEHSGALHLLRRMQFGSALARFIVAGSDRVVVVSRDLESKLRALCPQARRKIRVLSMGFTVTDERSAIRCSESLKEESRSRAKRVLFLGRLTDVKGAGVLLEAAGLLFAAQPEFKFEVTIAGEGPEEGSLLEIARGLQADVKFAGQVSAEERDRLLLTSDCLVIPSLELANGRTEGLPVVCLEAMGAGLPIIASRVGGLAEVITDGENGILFESGDCHSLAKKLSDLLSDEQLQRELAQNALATSKQYCWFDRGPRFADLIESVYLQWRSQSAAGLIEAKSKE